jgi:hypothetical protein
MLIDAMILKNKMVYDIAKSIVLACYFTVQAAIKVSIGEKKKKEKRKKRKAIKVRGFLNFNQTSQIC